MTNHVLALDIGGTKTVAALVERDGSLSQQITEPTSQAGPEAGIQQLIELCQQVITLGDATVSGIGIGIPAVLAPDDDLIIWAPNLEGWRQVALKPALEAAFGLPVAIEYDGHTAVLGEWWMGGGRGLDTFVDIIIGTGIGGGIIANGKLLRGYNRLAGAAGWFAMTTSDQHADGHAQGIGHWESLAAGPGIARRAQAALSHFPDSILHQVPITSEAVFTAAQQGDRLSTKIIQDTAQIIGMGIANVVSLINPQRVVLGGGVGSQCQNLLPQISETVKRWAQPASAESVEIVTSKLGTRAGLLGAAYAAFSRGKEEVMP